MPQIGMYVHSNKTKIEMQCSSRRSYINRPIKDSVSLNF